MEKFEFRGENFNKAEDSSAEKEATPTGEIIEVEGIEGRDVYNITAPFIIDGVKYIAGRVEERGASPKDEDYIPQTKFFTRDHEKWKITENTPTLPMEDPFVFSINNEVVVGGVEIYGEPGERKYRTVFLKGKDLSSLERFSTGPEMMKDIRLVQLLDGKIGVFTRPQGGEYKRGRIGFTIIDSLEELDEKNILNAGILREDLGDDEWEGVNSAMVLENGKIGVIGHIANIDEEERRHYRATAFIVDPATSEVENFKIIATRDDFPRGEAKAPDVEDVVFPGGVEKNEDGSYTLYVGLSDAAAGRIKIPNPFESK